MFPLCKICVYPEMPLSDLLTSDPGCIWYLVVGNYLNSQWGSLTLTVYFQTPQNELSFQTSTTVSMYLPSSPNTFFRLQRSQTFQIIWIECDATPPITSDLVSLILRA